MSWPIWSRKMPIWPMWTSHLFCHHFFWYSGANQNGSQLDPYFPILESWKTQNGHISKSHFAQVAITKKPTPPKPFIIDLYMDFASTNHGGFLIETPKKLSPKSKKKFYFWCGLKIFGGPEFLAQNRLSRTLRPEPHHLPKDAAIQVLSKVCA